MAEIKADVILTIDDDRQIRHFLHDFFKDFGYLVLEAENGRTGIELFTENKPDLVLVDLRMPIVDGFDVLAFIKKESPETPVIVISGTDDINDAINALQLGAWDYVLKPITSMTVLLNRVEKALDRAKLLRQNVEYQKNLEFAYRQLKEDLELAHNVQMKLFPSE